MSNYPSVESRIGIRGYITSKIPGMGGIIKTITTDFIVHEILPGGNPIFDGSELGEDVGGMYTHCVLQKEGLDTYSAIKKLSEILGIPEDHFGYAGLKDSRAVTFQRISIWNYPRERLKEISIPRINLLNPIQQKYAVKMGDLDGNFFQIKIRNILKEWDDKTWLSFINQINRRGILNYYASQRFGSKRPVLHLIGKYILQEKYDEVINAYLGEISSFENSTITALRKKYRNMISFQAKDFYFPRIFMIENKILKGLEQNHSAKKIVLNLPTYFLRLAISAFQSFLFNKLLSYLNENEFDLKNTLSLPIVGYQSNQQDTDETIWKVLLDFLFEEGLELNSFNHNQSNLRSKGTIRNAIVFPKNFEYIKENSEDFTVHISFSLPKGSYATILTRELTKNSTDLIVTTK